jgi:NADH-quinone oxidoreductase subunit J
VSEALFFVFGGLMVAFTMLTIWSRNPVYSAVFMILSFASTAGLFVLLEAHLIAIVEVLVYAGAIMVLFLFVLMLINLRAEEQEGLRLNPLMILAAGTFLVLLGRAIADLGPLTGTTPNDLVGSPEVIADSLFSKYVVPFEIVSVLLLAVILGIVVLARREQEV